MYMITSNQHAHGQTWGWLSLLSYYLDTYGTKKLRNTRLYNNKKSMTYLWKLLSSTLAWSRYWSRLSGPNIYLDSWFIVLLTSPMGFPRQNPWGMSSLAKRPSPAPRIVLFFTSTILWMIEYAATVHHQGFLQTPGTKRNGWAHIHTFIRKVITEVVASFVEPK